MVLGRRKSSNSSSFELTADSIKIAQNFDNDTYGSEFEISMSINIGTNKIKNYDNYYINGLYNTMNVAKTSYYIKTKGKTAIFAICKGMDSTESSFEGSRKIFGMLEQEQDEILKGKTLQEVKGNLKKFAVKCNEMLCKYNVEQTKGVSVLIVVYAYSGIVFMNSGCCSLLKIGKNRNIKMLTKQTDPFGVKENHTFEIKCLKCFLKSSVVLHTANINNVETEKIFFEIFKEKKMRDKTSVFAREALRYDVANDCTCMMIKKDDSCSIKPSTKATTIVCILITIISIIYALVQCYFGN